MSTGFLLEGENVLALDSGGGLHNLVNILKATNLYIFKGWVLWFVNYTSIKLLKKTESEIFPTANSGLKMMCTSLKTGSHKGLSPGLLSLKSWLNHFTQSPSDYSRKYWDCFAPVITLGQTRHVARVSRTDRQWRWSGWNKSPRRAEVAFHTCMNLTPQLCMATGNSGKSYSVWELHNLLLSKIIWVSDDNIL